MRPWPSAPHRTTTTGRTMLSMGLEPLRDVRNHYSEIMARVERDHERVTVRRDGHALAVILSPDDLAQLEGTTAVLSEAQALADIREADAASASGEVVRGVDAIRALGS
jgi:antitoxin YefM